MYHWGTYVDIVLLENDGTLSGRLLGDGRREIKAILPCAHLVSDPSKFTAHEELHPFFLGLSDRREKWCVSGLPRGYTVCFVSSVRRVLVIVIVIILSIEYARQSSDVKSLGSAPSPATREETLHLAISPLFVSS